MPSAAKISDSSLTEDILEHEFSRKFSTPTFDYYSGVSDPVQHIRHFQDKMTVYCNNSLFCKCGIILILLSVAPLSPQLRGGNQSVAHSVRLSSDAKKNNHLLSVKMRQSDNFKSYTSFFQSQLAKIPSCGGCLCTCVHQRVAGFSPLV